ncbi:asparagine synthase (glutamine-hydrolyzing) [Pseudalkalibacillus sp. NRS-1564]|uniref:asparagine synthase (glutamine-hydrolyzing) n=1 Tax=Pseudalkalibacillus sp. NRS-1564 TaxID=3233900 RepID=UPI003D2D2DA6
MCGITGWVDWKQNLTGEENVLRRMANTLSRRGPDASNSWVSAHCGFGHTRLIVVDPAGGSQPMTRTHSDKKYTICYNGELYNTEDLRKVLLAKGYTFQSHSDTEVLLTCYVEWGEQCVDHLNGIFAFGIWDGEKLFLARDRLGVKPLFYRQSGSSLQFGSELKAILAHPDVKTEVDRAGLQEIFGLGPSRTPGHGVFRGINELRPGFAMKFEQSGLRKWRYWNVKSSEHTDDLDTTVGKVGDLLKDSIKRQLVADVPVCTFLSGGVDSSAITSVAQTAFLDDNKGTLRSFSVDYVDNDKYFKSSEFQPNSDAPWIKKVSAELATDHTNCVIDTPQLVHHLKEAIECRDLPGMADVDSSLLWFSKEIKKHATVALSGECADEIFGGYPWFHKPELLDQEQFPWMRSTLERQAMLKEDVRNKLKLEDYVTERYRESIKETPVLDGESEIEAKRRALFYLNLNWFMTTLLERKDRMSMGASLEVRVPFSDHRIIEYVWNVPWDMKMLDGREKGLLRKAMTGTLSHDVLYRKKSPYPKTYNPAYTKAVSSWLQDTLDNKQSPLLELIDRKVVQDIIDSEGKAFKVPWFGQLMAGPQLIAHLAQINYWMEHHNVNLVD